jgi:hypothetical protein
METKTKIRSLQKGNKFKLPKGLKISSQLTPQYRYSVSGECDCEDLQGTSVKVIKRNRASVIVTSNKYSENFYIPFGYGNEKLQVQVQ